MKIISRNKPIIEDYSYAGGLKGKLKDLQGSGKVQGFLSKAQGVLGALGQGTAPSDSQVQPMVTPPPPAPKGMSKGLKIGLIVGGSVILLSVIGFIVYKSKKK
jgi:hypothetical protein